MKSWGALAAIAAILVLAAPAAASETTCTGTLTGQSITGDLIVPRDGACTLVDSTVSGDVEVGRNAYFEARTSTIGDDVHANRALTIFVDASTRVADDVHAWKTAQVFIFNSSIADRLEVWRASDNVHVCGNTVGGRTDITSSGRDILVGDPLAVDCAPNTFGDDVKIANNDTDVEFVVRGNTFADDLGVWGNRGPIEKFVQDNTGGDRLSCFGNQQPFTVSGNTGWSRPLGQCEEPPPTCTGTLTGQSITGDLIVPRDGACTLVDSTVSGDVEVGRNAYFEARTSTIGDDVHANRALTIFVDASTRVADDVHAWKTAQVFIFNSSIADRLEVWRASDNVHVCGNTVGGRTDITSSGRDILVGDPLAVDCAPNTFGDDVKIANNDTDVEFVVRGNTFADDLGVWGNRGPIEKFVQDNTGGDRLSCFGNQQPFTVSGNTGWSRPLGQCDSTV